MPRNRRYVRRTFRHPRRRGISSTLMSRNMRSRRIFWRFTRRAALRPEKKFSDVVTTSPNISPATPFSINVTPSTLAIGNTNGTRIGQQVKFFRVYGRYSFVDNSPTTLPLAAPSIQNNRVRIIFWTPRIIFNDALAYMNSLTILSVIDWNQVTILSDKMSYISPPYAQASVNNVPSGAPFAGRNLKKFNFKFPRNVKFGTANSNVDAERFSLTVTVISQDLNLIFNIYGRTIYTDS